MSKIIRIRRQPISAPGEHHVALLGGCERLREADQPLPETIESRDANRGELFPTGRGNDVHRIPRKVSKKPVNTASVVPLVNRYSWVTTIALSPGTTTTVVIASPRRSSTGPASTSWASAGPVVASTSRLVRRKRTTRRGYRAPMSLPERGREHDEILGQLETLRADDAKWRDGRTFGLVYDGGPEVHAIAEAAASMYLHENALNTLAMPSLGEIQRQVVGSMAELLHGDEAAGFMTSGGTESILMAVKSARERARQERGIDRGEIVLADSAHAAFHKGAHYFGLDKVVVPVGADYRCDVDAMSAALTDRTVLVVGSAPQYPPWCDRPDRRSRRARNRGRCQHACRRLHGRLHSALHGTHWRRDPAVGLSSSGRHVDLTRRAQARLRAERRFDHPSPQQESPPLSDLHLRRLARRVLRLAKHAGHPIRATNGCCVGGHAASWS